MIEIHTPNTMRQVPNSASPTRVSSPRMIPKTAVAAKVVALVTGTATEIGESLNIAKKVAEADRFTTNGRVYCQIKRSLSHLWSRGVFVWGADLSAWSHKIAPLRMRALVAPQTSPTATIFSTSLPTIDRSAHCILSKCGLIIMSMVKTSKENMNLIRPRLINRIIPTTMIVVSSSLLDSIFVTLVLVEDIEKTLAVYASGTDVAVEEADVSSETTGESSVVPEPSPVKSQRSRPARKSEMPPVKNEELIVGATFPGKVRSIQPFGAFVDFGAFTDGLIHVSQLSDSYVKDVASVVSVGQEVTVRLVEANLETGRISLSMRADNSSRSQQQRESPGGSDKSRPPRRTGQNSDQRREDPKKFSKFVKGQDLEGTVKNLTRSGAFISLPEGEEGFLPQSEENDGGFGTIMGVTSLEIGQEVSVRVLRLSRGKVTLTMKKDEDVKEVDSKLQETDSSSATDDSELIISKQKRICYFFPDSDVTDEETPNAADDIKAEVEEKSEETDSSSVTQDNEVTAAIDSVGSDGSSVETESGELEAKPAESPVTISDNLGADIAVNGVENQTSGDSQPNGDASSSSEQSSNDSPKEATVKGQVFFLFLVILVYITSAVPPALVKQLREETGAGMMDCKRALSEAGGDIEKAYEYLRKKGLASADKKSSRATAEGRFGSYIHDSRIGVLIEVNCETDFVARGDIFKELVEDLAMQVAACPQVQYLSPEDVSQEFVDKEKEIEMQKEDLLSKPEQIRSKIVEGRIKKRLEELALLEQPFIKDDKVVVKDWVKQTIATIGENIKVKRFTRYNLGEGLEKKSQDFAAEVAAQTAAKPVSTSTNPEPAATETKETVQEPPKAAVSASLVKQLREETGAGMMDCKKALSETGGDLEKAHEYLRKKGLAAADKKSSRIAAEGRIGSYIHDSRIGVLIEVNCETDFVGRSESFKELVEDLAMQVAACPQVQYVSVEDVPESIVAKEKELEMQREDLQSKPESIREKIVDGRIAKRLGELALLEQAYIKNDTMLVKDLVKQTVATLGENIKVRRFARFTLGETRDAVVEEQA
ncbi:hypothetical protein SASPL_112916 [Salvia splendens]|uniref:Elongation factor Ts, mitochondrial n=1 Tax=Salvia splendens TaxID=180675 RepID=A0A8X8Y9Z9_SALSN|nr:hypothetical protein SASPL_112916 [Salvia splendens]